MWRSGTHRMIFPPPLSCGAHLLTGLSCLIDLASVWRYAPSMAVVFLTVGSAVLLLAGASAGQAAPFSEEVECVRTCDRCHP
jgi:hypothetical protein